MIAEVKGARLLQGFRGRPAADLAALADTLQRAAEGRRGVVGGGAIERRGMERVAAWQSSRHRCVRWLWCHRISSAKRGRLSSQWNTRGRFDEPDRKAPTDTGPEPARHERSPPGLSGSSAEGNQQLNRLGLIMTFVPAYNT
jgi:hypothetical protein